MFIAARSSVSDATGVHALFDGVRRPHARRCLQHGSANYRWRFSPLVDSSGSDKYTSWLPSNDPARKGRQHRCRSKAGRPTRPSRHKKDTAVRVSTTRQQGLAFRDTRGSQLPLLLPSRLPTNLKLVSSTSWNTLKRTSLHTNKPKRVHQGATTKGAQAKEERSYFRDS